MRIITETLKFYKDKINETVLSCLLCHGDPKDFYASKNLYMTEV